jgi:hypothetical protein
MSESSSQSKGVRGRLGPAMCVWLYVCICMCVLCFYSSWKLEAVSSRVCMHGDMYICVCGFLRFGGSEARENMYLCVLISVYVSVVWWSRIRCQKRGSDCVRMIMRVLIYMSRWHVFIL